MTRAASQPRNTKIRRMVRLFFKEERGQVLPIMALMMISLLGMLGMITDIGHVSVAYHQLQDATDAAALAGAQSLPSTTASTLATQYSGLSGDYNSNSRLSGVTMVSGYPQLKCLSTLQNMGMACSSPSNANAIVVQQQVVVPMYFARVLGHSSMTLSATATAAMRGASSSPYNVAIIVDTTLSMAEYDSDCGATQLACALNGVQTLLQNLSPCASSLSSCTVTNGVAANSVDNVAIFTFPNLTVGTVGIDTNCTTPIPASYQTGTNRYGQATYTNSNYNSSYGYYTMQGMPAYPGVPSATGYTFPSATATSYSPSGNNTGTYQVTPFQSDYKSSSATSSLNTNSNVVQAAGGDPGCGGLGVPNYDGNYGTYYAGVLYAAQSALLAQQAANPGSQNVIILLSDGNSTAPSPQQSPGGATYPAMPSPAGASGLYPSYVNECSQAIIAAKAATAAGTRVYTVAYGSEPSGCASDTSGTYAGITPCQAMEYMASAAQYFYSDWKQSGSNSTCYSSAQPVTALSDIFTQIAGDMTVARLIPNNTT